MIGAVTHRHVLVFDVNETLLDLRALAPRFEQVFGDGALYSQWFDQVQQSALLTVVTGRYCDFGQVGRAALDMLAQRRGTDLTDRDRGVILGAMRTLPPHPDVVPALERLRRSGRRLAALTNSPPEIAQAQLTNAGVATFMEAILSVDAVKSLKPAAKVYRYAARQLGVAPAGMRLIAAHAWDVAGAMRAGCAAAFVARPGRVPDPLFAVPDVVAPDLLGVAEQLIG